MLLGDLTACWRLIITSRPAQATLVEEDDKAGHACSSFALVPVSGR